MSHWNRPPAFLAATLALAIAACNSRAADESPLRIGPSAAATVVDSASPAVATTDAAARSPDTLAAHDAAIPVAATAELHVPRARARIVPTGHFDVHAWAGAVNTGTLLDKAGLGAVPVSEARFLWDDHDLYVFFYAGDLDLQAHTTKHDGPVWNDDSVVLRFPSADGTQRIIQVSVTGVVADGACPGDAASLADSRCDLRWESGVHVGTDSDGTLNHIGDRDEEWAVEAAIPLAAIGIAPGKGLGARVPFAIGRCEMAFDGPRACGSWGDSARGSNGSVLVLEER